MYNDIFGIRIVFWKNGSGLSLNQQNIYYLILTETESNSAVPVVGVLHVPGQGDWLEARLSMKIHHPGTCPSPTQAHWGEGEEDKQEHCLKFSSFTSLHAIFCSKCACQRHPNNDIGFHWCRGFQISKARLPICVRALGVQQMAGVLLGRGGVAQEELTGCAHHQS